ncbi:MAG: hypothetical protein BWY09_00620 [Candidatus Hydrogenedentes bacterium ADurb.Bin179]|nr:MAG: hypothetical protein BWY09_00620 [Candidatus Hydrogenedentes bacterium ADurb.Bin179]
MFCGMTGAWGNAPLWRTWEGKSTVPFFYEKHYAAKPETATPQSSIVHYQFFMGIVGVPSQVRHKRITLAPPLVHIRPKHFLWV